MTRTLSGGETSESGVEAVWLLEMIFWDGSSEVSLHMATAGDDLDSDVTGSTETYTGAGDFLEWGGAQETEDRRAQGTQLKLSGVDTTVMSTLLNNDFRGRRARLWRARVENGAVTDTRLMVRSRQLEDYQIEEKRPEKEGEPASCTITTRIVSQLAALQGTNTVFSTVASHNAMLARAGESTGDSFFRYLPNLGRFFWGSEVPAAATDGSNDDATAGGGGDPWRPTGGDLPGETPSV